MSEREQVAAKRARVDWDALRPHYEAGIRALKDIGREFECSDAAIIKHAREHGWARCLKDKIRAKADLKVAQALAAQEHKDSPAGRLTEAVRVEVESEVQARVRLEHRTDIQRSKRIVNRLLERLEGIAFVAKDAAAEVYEHARAIAKLVDSQHKLVSMEREAYGIAQMVSDGDDEQAIDQMEGARRVAFILARATAQLTPTVH